MYIETEFLKYIYSLEDERHQWHNAFFFKKWKYKKPLNAKRIDI